MYLVDDKLMELILQRTDPRYLELHARLSPSAKVIPIETVSPTFTVYEHSKLGAYIPLVLEEEPVDIPVIEHTYEYDYDSNPVVTLDDDNIVHIYHPYKKRK